MTGLTEEVDRRNEARVEYAEVNVCLPPYASDRYRSDEHDDCKRRICGQQAILVIQSSHVLGTYGR